MSATNRTRLIAGAFVAAAVAVPLYASTTTPAPDVSATPPCLAWFGNKEDGKCLSYSNGNGVNVGTPQFNYCPGVNLNRDNCGWTSGPLLPGYTISERRSALPKRSFLAAASGSRTSVSESIGVNVTKAGSGETRSAILRRPASITALAAGLAVTARAVPAICSYRRRPAFAPKT